MPKPANSRLIGSPLFENDETESNLVVEPTATADEIHADKRLSMAAFCATFWSSQLVAPPLACNIVESLLACIDEPGVSGIK